jgi:hypothetical protein
MPVEPDGPQDLRQARVHVRREEVVRLGSAVGEDSSEVEAHGSALDGA